MALTLTTTEVFFGFCAPNHSENAGFPINFRVLIPNTFIIMIKFKCAHELSQGQFDGILEVKSNPNNESCQELTWLAWNVKA